MKWVAVFLVCLSLIFWVVFFGFFPFDSLWLVRVAVVKRVKLLAKEAKQAKEEKKGLAELNSGVQKMSLS